MRLLVRTYKEKWYKKIPTVRLSDEDYARALRCLVPVCADIVPIDVGTRTIYLASRTSKPMTGWWWIGGKLNPSETKEEAAIRNFKQETGLDLTADRLRLVGIFDYLWKDRQQEPQEIGCHMLAFTFTVNLSSEEIAFASSNLERTEYDRSKGLTPFNRDGLVKAGVFPTILDLYDQIFADECPVEA